MQPKELMYKQKLLQQQHPLTPNPRTPSTHSCTYPQSYMSLLQL